MMILMLCTVLVCRGALELYYSRDLEFRIIYFILAIGVLSILHLAREVKFILFK